MRHLILISALFMFGSMSALAAGDFKMATVDMQRALQTVDMGKKAKSTLEKEFNEKKKQLGTEEEAIKKMTEDLKKQASVLSAESRMKKEGDIQDRMMKYRELFGKSQFDIQNRERELTEPIIGMLREVVGELGKSKGFTLIIEKGSDAIIYSSGGEDVTEAVIQAFNKKHNG